MDKFLEYAPWLVVAFLFFKQNKMFVTPEALTNAFSDFNEKLEKKFVLQETYKVAMNGFKEDLSEMKDKIDKIYDAIIKKTEL